MPQVALFRVPLQALAALAVLEAELADVDAGHGAHLLRVRGKVPRLDTVPAEFDELYVLHARHYVVMVCHHAA
uniref:Putative secreted protein n=1 Tax=Anopheles marajoara TaxID=58244 RepID=A0A2M4CDQ4_9DIPT